MSTSNIPFDNSYARELQGFYEPCQPESVPAPKLLFFNHSLADALQLGLGGHDPDSLAAMFSGNALPEGAMPIAQAYSGHQFGSFSAYLGDGRAHLIGEVIDCHGVRRDIALKGSGRTPFSRNGDGKAAVGPMLREVLIGEAMHALGIPTTRALAVVATGEMVRRERMLPGAVLTRIAESHLRVGTFEFFSAHTATDRVRKLADYAIARHDPELLDTDNRYMGFLSAVAERQAALLAQWMHFGFIHGVMNTDNMSVSGETIDYGPCAFMEAYDPRTVFSSIDAGGRYAYQAQPHIARWNLARLAETLLPLIDADDEQAIVLASDVINDFPARYRHHWLTGMRAKLGLHETECDGENADTALAENWLDLLHAQQVDFTLAWRRLADAAEGNEAPLRALFSEQPTLDIWLERWRTRCTAEDAQQSNDVHPAARRAEGMRRANPWLIPRNQRVEEALSAASDEGDLTPFEQLLNALRQPFDEDPALSHYAEPAPAVFTENYRTFCGT